LADRGRASEEEVVGPGNTGSARKDHHQKDWKELEGGSLAAVGG